ncbi:Beta-galactosidase BgaB [Nonomuraea coxensis DSM 45129]|uniref:Beta-galactosidase n=1 Tax=Nonomuraea coxensis DSM 45129 TaxID=1122611 RepID=A0ABX8U4Z2_9ACTN|nr:beta-galactosidase [Nonomuraea coxensis]QYC42739.1 Beta-galactosidase BgaB [Nonomuraea coxensis DSM 45129]
MSRMDAFRARMGGLAYGGDYNPEQWDREVWREDVRLMREAGVNLVSLGVFAWASLEPEPGTYEFGWLDEVMDLLHDNGIAVNLATPTAAPPVWLTHLHPEVFPVREDGQPFGFGNRLHYDPSSPIYRRHAAAITTKLAERYSFHPALAMWHISNEYGPTAYNEAAAVSFRRWLRRRYGTLDRLNEAWTTRFWGQVYTDWEQIDVPHIPRTWMNPTRRLDFKRFTSDALLECFVAERDIVRSFRDDLPVLTNFMRFFRHADYWRWAPEEDAAALDIYPDPADPGSHVPAAFNFDLFRSLKGGQPWLLMEQSSSAVSQWRLNVVKEPGRMRLGSLQALARASDSVMFFQWRASRGGQERFHSAMVPHSGPDSRTFREIKDLGRELRLLAPVAGTTSRAEIAILFDWDGWWGLEEVFGLPRSDFGYTGTVMRHYTPLWERHHAVDVVPAGAPLDGYKVLVVPNAYLMGDEGVRRVTGFARAGGTVLMSFFSGVVDADNRVRPDGYPGAFRELIGAKIDEYWPARPDERFTVEFMGGRTATSTWWREDLRLEGGTALATYADGLLAGRAAVVENRYGAGRVVYVATLLEQAAFDELVAATVEAAGVRTRFAGVPAHVECAVRGDETHEYVFLLNHSGESGASVPLETDGTDLLTGRAVAGRVELAPLGAAVVRIARRSALTPPAAG